VVTRYTDKDKYRYRGALVNPSGERKDRPGYAAMLKAAHAREFDVIVAWKEDRLYRGMYAALPLSEVLDEHRNDLQVELVKETFDRQMLGIKAAIAKLELDNIRDRMVMGRKVRIERGEPPGGPVHYGYNRSENKRVVVNEAEASVVRQVY
jgi:DNA invertase Pin-like site-specific DNA recombinase